MKHLTLAFVLIATSNLFSQSTLEEAPFRPPQNRVLVVSGGGARGAWGVGVCKALLEKYHGYKAIYGTSTGSLMAPMIMLQKMKKLEYNYCNVTQKKIFNVNPFKVIKEPLLIDGEPVYDSLMSRLDGKKFQVYRMTSDIKRWNAGIRAIRGKSTVGETYNLLKLIHNQFTVDEFKILKNLAKTNGYEMGLGLTNMKTGKFDMAKLSELEYDRFTNFMWASANQPIFMTYVFDSVKNAHFVDGGVLELLPINQAIDYALNNGIDSIDIVLNNTLYTIDSTSFDANLSLLNGLMGVLNIYNQSTLSNNLEISKLKARLDSFERAGIQNPRKKSIKLNIYSMNSKLAKLYSSDLGFDSEMMRMILNYGYYFAKERLESSIEISPKSNVNNEYDINVRRIEINRY